MKGMEGKAEESISSTWCVLKATPCGLVVAVIRQYPSFGVECVGPIGVVPRCVEDREEVETIFASPDAKATKIAAPQ